MSHTLEEVIEVLEEYRNNPQLQYEVDTYLLARNKEYLIRKKGIEDGGKEKQLEIAKNMLNSNVPIKTIIKCTGLTEEEIKKLQ